MFTRIASFFLCWILVAGCQTTPGIDEATLFFNDIAFPSTWNADPVAGIATADANYAGKSIRRWEQPIAIFVGGEKPEGAQAKIDQTFQDAADVTGIRYAFVEDREKANFQIDFDNLDKYVVNTVQHVRCYTRPTSSNGRMESAIVRIGLKDNYAVEHCIVHEILHGLGLGHAHNLPSAVNYRMALERMSKWDRAALQLIYDSRFRGGMTRKDALPMARQMLKTIIEPKQRSDR